MVEGNGTWDNVSLGFSNTPGLAGPVTFVNVELDPTPAAPILRWNQDGDFSGNVSGNPISLAAAGDAPATYVGLRHPYPAGWDLLDRAGRQLLSGANGRTLYYLASAQYAGGYGVIYLQVGPQGITRAGGNPDTDSVYFGFNDEPVRGNQIGATSTFGIWLRSLNFVPLTSVRWTVRGPPPLAGDVPL